MKKLGIILIPIIFALNFPMSPQSLIPNTWLTSFETGKKWAQLFFNFYRSQTSEAANSQQAPSLQPLLVRDFVVPADLRPVVTVDLKKCEASLKARSLAPTTVAVTEPAENS